MPSEEQVASTVRLSVTSPADVRITSIPPVKGWTAAMVKNPDGTTNITWTAQGSGLPPAQAIDFFANTGALPDRPTLSFDATQTYSNGDEVYWNEPQAGATLPPFPAPVLKTAGATPGAQPDIVRGGPAATPTRKPTVSIRAAASAAASTGTPVWAVSLGIGGGVAIAAVATMMVIVLRRRLRSARP